MLIDISETSYSAVWLTHETGSRWWNSTKRHLMMTLAISWDKCYFFLEVGDGDCFNMTFSSSNNFTWSWWQFHSRLMKVSQALTTCVNSNNNDIFLWSFVVRLPPCLCSRDVHKQGSSSFAPSIWPLCIPLIAWHCPHLHCSRHPLIAWHWLLDLPSSSSVFCMSFSSSPLSFYVVCFQHTFWHWYLEQETLPEPTGIETLAWLAILNLG